MAGKRLQDRATERVAVLMTPAEKSAFAERASSLGMSLGQFFREAGGRMSIARASQTLLMRCLRSWSSVPAELNALWIAPCLRSERPLRLSDERHRSNGNGAGAKPIHNHFRALPR